MTEQSPPPRLSREQAKEKLRAFLKQGIKQGNSEDVASLLVHSLMQQAEKKQESEEK